MLHYRGQRHRKRPRQLADRQAFVVGKPQQQRPPGGVGQRREGAVQRGILMLNHSVKFRRAAAVLSTRFVRDHEVVRRNLPAMNRPTRPSIAAMPTKIAAMPTSCRELRLSPSSTTPMMIALTGMRNVVSSALVAPARTMSRK